MSSKGLLMKRNGRESENLGRVVVKEWTMWEISCQGCGDASQGFAHIVYHDSRAISMTVL